MPNLIGSFLPIIVVLVLFAIVAGVVKVLLAGGPRSQGGLPTLSVDNANTMKSCRTMCRSASVAATIGIMMLGAFGCKTERGPLREIERLAPQKLSRAQYVRLECLGAYRNWPGGVSLTVIQSGNAWLVRENAKAESEFVINGCERIRLYDKHVLAKLRRVTFAQRTDSQTPWPYHRGYVDGKLGGEWRHADLHADVTNVIAFLRGAHTLSHRVRHGDLSLNQKGRLLLFAVNVAKTGNRGEANEIARLLLDLGRKDDIVRAAISQVADARYAELSRKLIGSGDREAFLDGIVSLEKKFGDKWNHRRAIIRQIESMRNRQASAIRSEEEKAFLVAIDSRGLARHHAVWWALPRMEENVEANGNEAINGLLRKRFEAIPFLISLLDDYTPTSVQLHEHLGLTGPGEGCMTGWGYMDPILMVWLDNWGDLLPRPVTRAEIAWALLGATIWMTDGDLSINPQDSEEPFLRYKEIVQAWYDARKDKTDLELCRDYLSVSWRAPHPVMGFLLEHGDGDDIEAIEIKLLKETGTYSAFENVLPYIRLRGGKASSFLDAYEKALMRHVDDELANGQDEMYIAEVEKKRPRFRRIVKDLRSVMEGTASVRSILQDIVSGKVQWNDACNSYWMALDEEDPDVGLREALTASLQTDNAILRHSIVQSAVVKRRRREVTVPVPGSGSLAGFSAEDRSAWRRLLDDTQARWVSPVNTSRLACLLEMLVGTGSDDMDHDRLVEQLGDEAAQRFIARAYDRLDGKAHNELAPLPDAARVSQERRTEMAAQLMGAEDIGNVLVGLTLDEQLALADMAESDPELNRALLPYANRIITAELKHKQDDELSARLQSMLGRSLSVRMVREFHDMCLAEVQSGRFVYGGITRDPLLNGVRIRLQSSPPELWKTKQGYVSRQSYLKAWVFMADGRNAYAMWPVEVSDAVRQEVNNIRFTDGNVPGFGSGGGPRAFDPGNEPAQQHLWQVVERFLGSEGNAAKSQYISWSGEVGSQQ